jgi:hypothetical protein
VAGLAPALLPLGLDLGDVVQAADDEVPARRGQTDEPGAAVGGIGPALDPAAALEARHELAHRLVCHRGPSSQLGQARALRVDVLVEGVVGGMDTLVAVTLEALDQLVDHEPRGLSEGHHDGERPLILVAQGAGLSLTKGRDPA